MGQELEIDGKVYTFIANRKAICTFQKINKEDEAELLDIMFYALLKTKHNLTREEISELLDIAEKEYKVADLLEFCSKVMNEAFTKDEEKKKKIAFLSHK